MIPNKKRSRKPRDIAETMIAGLRERGYRLTPQRLEIIGLLARDTSHPRARNIAERVRRTLPQVSVSTVYYTLDVLKKEGLIRELEYDNTDNRYDVNVSDHINLVCTRCGRITDFMGDIRAFAKRVERETGFRPAGMRFEYYGMCGDCTGGNSG